MEKIKGFWLLEIFGLFWVGRDNEILRKDCKSKEEALEFIKRQVPKIPLRIRVFKEAGNPIFIPTVWREP